MNAPLFLDVRFTAKQIERLREEYPELADDAQLLADTLEGQTAFEPIMERVTEEFLDAVAMREAVAIRMSALKERGERFERKAEAMKGLAIKLMEAASVPTLRLASATLSIRKPVASAIVDDIAELPQGFFRLERVPLKAEIKSALEGNTTVPGAHLDPGQIGLTIRTK